MKQKDVIRVEFIEDLFGAGGDRLADLVREVTGNGDPRIFLVADGNVVQRQTGLGAAIGRWVNGHFLALAGAPVILPGGERIKSDDFQSVRTVASAAVSAKLSHSDVILALGGGAVLDVAGYVASQVRGGVPLVRVPTTVLAMLDSSFARTAAIDDADVKDAFVVPSIPAFSVIDLAFASTVLDGVWRAGFAEALRLAAVKDAKLVKRLVELAQPFHDRDAASLKEVVTSVVAVRQKKGGTDFARWSAQRLQAMSTYKLPHGHAIAIGVAIDLHVATVCGYLSASDRDLMLGALATSGASEAIFHNRHLISYVESLARGLDAWRLATGSASLVYPAGLGKEILDEKPDVETVKAALATVSK